MAMEHPPFEDVFPIEDGDFILNIPRNFRRSLLLGIRKAQAAPEEKAASGSGDGYTWKDEGEELEVIFEVAESTSKKDVKIEFRRTEVRMLKPKTQTLKLYKAVEVDGCNWSMGKAGQVILTLEKCDATPWRQPLKEVEGLYL